MPYVQLLDGDSRVIAQFSMAEARNIAHNILTMCARTEADAMIHKFFNKNNYPEGAANALMGDFREFRSQLDAEPIETAERIPEEG